MSNTADSLLGRADAGATAVDVDEGLGESYMGAPGVPPPLNPPVDVAGAEPHAGLASDAPTLSHVSTVSNMRQQQDKRRAFGTAAKATSSRSVEVLVEELTSAFKHVELKIPQATIREIVEKEASRPGFSLEQKAAESGLPLELVTSQMARELFSVVLVSQLWDLQHSPSYATNKKNEEREEANAMEQRAEVGDLDPDLSAIQERALQLAQVVQTVGSLGLEGVDTQVQIAAAHDMATRLEQWARNTGKKAISEGKLSQRQLSRILGVAELTVGRWMKDRRQDDQQDQ